MKANQLSQTAAFIAIKFYGLTQMTPFRSWFDGQIIDFYDEMVDFLPAPLNWYHTALQKSWIRTFFLHSEELLLPGDLMHIICRKYFIGRRVNELLSEGYEQLLILGAGFDHLSALHSQHQIPCIEVDAPHMSDLKTTFLKSTGRMNPYLVTHSIPQPRRHASLPLDDFENLDPGRKTIIIAEGFFDYLESNHAETILYGLASFFRNDTILISTIFALDQLSSPRRAIFKAGVRMVGERIKLKLSKEEFETLVDSTGFSRQLLEISNIDMQKQFLEPKNISLPVLEGFYLTYNKKSADY